MKNNEKKDNLKIQNNPSYNPFKMWGAWVGIIAYPAMLSLINTDKIKRMSFSSFPSLNEALEMIVLLFFLFLFGFLLGWGIHSLCRYLKNKKVEDIK